MDIHVLKEETQDEIVFTVTLESGVTGKYRINKINIGGPSFAGAEGSQAAIQLALAKEAGLSSPLQFAETLQQLKKRTE